MCLKVGQTVLPVGNYFTSGIQSSHIGCESRDYAIVVSEVVVRSVGAVDALATVVEGRGRRAGNGGVGRTAYGVGQVQKSVAAQIDVSVGGIQSCGVRGELRNVAGVVVEVVPLTTVTGHTVSSVEEGSG